MFNSMTGTVGFAMHEERLAQAARNLRLMEAAQGKRQRREVTGEEFRAVVAQVLVVLATRIAPTISLPNTSTQALAQ